MTRCSVSISVLLLLCAATVLFAQTKPAAPAKPAAPQPAVAQARGGGKLVYATTANGDRMPDFSTAGYMGGVPIPDAPVRVVVPRADGDSTARIQAALDHVASLPLDKTGLR